MRVPLSAVMVSLYMLESGRYLHTVLKNTKWYSYVDDVPMITHSNTNIENLLHRLNHVRDKTRFTVETENGGRLPLLDTIIMR